MKVRIVDQPNIQCVIRFQKKGWLSREEYKCEGEVYETLPGKSKKQKERMIYKIHGHWSGEIFISKFLPDQYDKNG